MNIINVDQVVLHWHDCEHYTASNEGSAYKWNDPVDVMLCCPTVDEKACRESDGSGEHGWKTVFRVRNAGSSDFVFEVAI